MREDTLPVWLFAIWAFLMGLVIGPRLSANAKEPERLSGTTGYMIAGGHTADGKSSHIIIVDSDGRVICSPSGDRLWNLGR